MKENFAISPQRQTLGARIRHFRTRHNLSQAMLAEKANISLVFMSKIENNHSRPSLETLTLIADALGTSIDELLSRPQKQMVDVDRLITAIARTVREELGSPDTNTR